MRRLLSLVLTALALALAGGCGTTESQEERQSQSDGSDRTSPSGVPEDTEEAPEEPSSDEQ